MSKLNSHNYKTPRAQLYSALSEVDLYCAIKISRFTKLIKELTTTAS